jgi:hypothetical protein
VPNPVRRVQHRRSVGTLGYNSRRFTLSNAVSCDYKISQSFAPLGLSREIGLWTVLESANTLIAGKKTDSFSAVGGAASKTAYLTEGRGPAGNNLPAKTRIPGMASREPSAASGSAEPLFGRALTLSGEVLAHVSLEIDTNATNY